MVLNRMLQVKALNPGKSKTKVDWLSSFFSVLDVLSSRESVLFSPPKEGQYLPHRSGIRAVSRVF